MTVTILGIGVDLVHLPRIANLLGRRDPERFARRILSETELLQWKDLDASRQAQFLGVRYVHFLDKVTDRLQLMCSWCVKEAAYKAFYPTVKPRWKELTYRGMLECRKPTLEYHPMEKEKAKKIERVHVSVSHDGEYVYSSVLIEGSLIIL